MTATVSALAPQTTYHYRVVATNWKGTAHGVDVTFTTTEVGAEPPPNDPGVPSGPGAGPPPSGDPQPGSTVAVTPGRGTVQVRVRGSSEFVPLAAGSGLPFGSEVDTSKGTVSLTSVLPSGASQTGQFGGGRFVIRSGARGYIDLHLRGRFCSHPRAQRGSEAVVRLCVGGPPSACLWGKRPRGRSRTHGKHSHATVRGTRWLVEDRCNGTFTSGDQGLGRRPGLRARQAQDPSDGRELPRTRAPVERTTREAPPCPPARTAPEGRITCITLLAFAAGAAVQVGDGLAADGAREPQGTLRGARRRSARRARRRRRRRRHLPRPAPQWPFPRSLHARASPPQRGGRPRDRLRRPVHRADDAARGPRALRALERAGGASWPPRETDERGDTNVLGGDENLARDRRARRRRRPRPTTRRRHRGCRTRVGGLRDARRRGRRAGRRNGRPRAPSPDGGAWIDYRGPPGHDADRLVLRRAERARPRRGAARARSSWSAPRRRRSRTSTPRRRRRRAHVGPRDPGERDLDRAPRPAAAQRARAGRRCCSSRCSALVAPRAAPARCACSRGAAALAARRGATPSSRSWRSPPARSLPVLAPLVALAVGDRGHGRRQPSGREPRAPPDRARQRACSRSAVRERTAELRETQLEMVAAARPAPPSRATARPAATSSASSHLCQRARARHGDVRGRGRAAAPRQRAARRRQDRHPGRDPAQARPSSTRGARR